MEASTGVRILHVTDNLRVGGVQSVVVALANAQAARGGAVAVAAGPGPLWGELSPQVRRVLIREGRLMRLRGLARLVRVLSQGWDVVHTHQRGVSVLVWLCGRVLRFRHVEHVHNVFLPATRRKLSFRGDILIACGSAVGEMLTQVYGRPSSRVHIVRNGVSDHGFRAIGLRRTDGALRILNIARVSAQKDPERFVRVVRAIHASGLDVDAVWVGGGEHLEVARQYVQQQNVESVVQFRGPMRPASQALQDSHIFLSTSQWEGLPLALIEAAAAGLPLIAPDIGSVRDVVRDGINGYLYSNSATDEEIAALVVEVARDEVKRQRFGAESRRIYEEEFTLERVASSVDHLYKMKRQAS